MFAMQAVAAAESTASLLGDEVDRLKKEASQKLSDAVRPLQQRVDKLETSAKARVCAPRLGTAKCLRGIVYSAATKHLCWLYTI